MVADTYQPGDFLIIELEWNNDKTLGRYGCWTFFGNT